MRALITGASNGLGHDFAYKLAKEGYDLVLVARSEEKLDHIQNDLKKEVEVITEVMDLSVKDNAHKLYEKYKGSIDLLVNNAGFGECGLFNKTSLDNELNMIDLNIVSLHILTKLFLADFVKDDKGQILNVASLASFEPGPLMATYYSTKSYVYNLTMAIYEELRRKRSHVKVSVLCPGPTDTGFNTRAKVRFGVKSLTSEYVTSYTIKKLKRNKLLIIPSFRMKMAVFGVRFMPRKLLLRIIYNIQERKTK